MGVLSLAPLRAGNSRALVWVFGVAVNAPLAWCMAVIASG
jgi:hypothetical protein